MPPNEQTQIKEVKCFFCEDDKETPINPTFTECTAEDFAKDLKDVMQKVQDAPKCFTPTHIMADLKCRPKKIKDFILDMQTQLDSRAEARAKYRNYKIPRRRRMILKAAKMNKHNIYVFCIPPINLIEMKFFSPDFPGNTMLVFTNMGNCIVKETPEEIAKMIYNAEHPQCKL